MNPDHHLRTMYMLREAPSLGEKKLHELTIWQLRNLSVTVQWSTRPSQKTGVVDCWCAGARWNWLTKELQAARRQTSTP